MGEMSSNLMSFIKVYIKAKLKQFLHSRFFLGLICLVIGATGMFVYLEAPKVFEPYKIVMDFNRSAEASEVERGSDTLVKTGVQETEIVEPRKPDITSLISSHFGADAENFEKIMGCESQGETDKIGDTHITFEQDGKTYGMSCGLFQVRSLPGRPTCEEMLDAEENIKYAKKIFDRQGYGAWRVCSQRLGYL